MLKKYRLILLGIILIAIAFLIKNYGNRAQESQKNKQPAKPTSSKQPNQTDRNKFKEPILKPEPSAKNVSILQDDKVITQAVKIRIKFNADRDNADDDIHIRFLISGVDRKDALLKLGHASIKREAQFEREYTYKKPEGRRDKLIIEWDEFPVFQGRRLDSSTGLVSKAGDMRLFGSYSRSIDITQNPMIIDLQGLELPTGELILKLNFLDKIEGMSHSMRIHTKAEGADLGFDISYVKTGVVKLKLPAGMRLFLTGETFSTSTPELSNSEPPVKFYENWTAEVELDENGIKYLDIVIEKSLDRFKGICLDETGNPVEDVRIYVYQKGRDFNATSREDGTFQLNIDESAEIDEFLAERDYASAFYQHISPSVIKKVVLKKTREYKILFEFPEDFKQKLFLGHTKILYLSGTDILGREIQVYENMDKPGFDKSIYTQPGKTTFRFLTFNDVHLEWKLYYEKAITLPDNPEMQEIRITVPQQN
ncbi:MAG: hypothetical protein HY606_05995 [Planctomycetes bacterium]|nr:hypothetical protein [Planctomycetota bacterium]